METTTIKLGRETKVMLDNFREYKNESYDEVLKKLIYVAKTARKQPKLSQKTIKRIEEARKRIKAGEFYTEDEADRILGYSE